MAGLDDFLKLLGLSPIQVRWRWRRFRERLQRRRENASRRVEWFGYQHKICPLCGHPADRGDKLCPSCGTRLGSHLENRLGRVTRWLAPEGATLYTGVLTLLNVVIFAQMLRQGGLSSLLHPSAAVLQTWGAWSTYSLHQGEWWRLVTSNFVHFGVLHLLMNSWSLFSVGPLVEDLFGRSRFAFIYLATGVAGMALSAWWRWDRQAIVAGASASIFGLIGACIGYGIRRGGRYGKALRETMTRWAVWALFICIFMPADNAAHLGGGLMGLALGWVVPGSEDRRSAGLWRLLEVSSLLAAAVSFFLLTR